MTTPTQNLLAAGLLGSWLPRAYSCSDDSSQACRHPISAAFRPTARAKTCYKTAPFSHLTCADARHRAGSSQSSVFKGHCMRKCTPRPPYRAYCIQRKPTHSFVSQSRSPKTQLQPDKSPEDRCKPHSVLYSSLSRCVQALTIGVCSECCCLTRLMTKPINRLHAACTLASEASKVALRVRSVHQYDSERAD